jgi:hypothetical protein
LKVGKNNAQAAAGEQGRKNRQFAPKGHGGNNDKLSTN